MSAYSLQIHQHGAPTESLQLVEHEVPTPARGEVLVKMLAAPINPSDRLHIRGKYREETTLPAGVGFEGVGIVTKNGGGLLGRMIQGGRVAVLASDGGTWATHCVVNAKRVIAIPYDLSMEQAPFYFINPATACILTHQILGMQHGAWLLQSAGTSSVGRMVIALGAQNGFKTLSLVRHEEDVEDLMALGGDVVIDTSQLTDAHELRTQILGHCGELPKAAIDSVGGEVGSMMIQALGKGGRMVCFGTASQESLSIDPRTLMQNELTIESFWLGPYMQKQSLFTKLGIISQLKKLHLRGVFPAPSTTKFTLKEHVAALQEAEAAEGGHKVLFVNAD